MLLIYLIDLFKFMTTMLEKKTKTKFSNMTKKQVKHFNAIALVGVAYPNISVYRYMFRYSE